MSIDEKLVTIADNVEKVYGKGYGDGEEAFWRLMTNNGERDDYTRFFKALNLGDDYTIPEGLVVPTSDIQQMFYNYKAKKLPKGIDLSQTGSATVSTSNYAAAIFMWSLLEEIYDMGLPHTTPQGVIHYNQTFLRCDYLKKIEVLRVCPKTSYTSTFGGCSKLESLTIDGVIGENGFNVSSCPLNHDSLMSIINALEDKTSDTSGTSWVIALGTENKAKLSEAELKIAEDRNWEVV